MNININRKFYSNPKYKVSLQCIDSIVILDFIQR